MSSSTSSISEPAQEPSIRRAERRRIGDDALAGEVAPGVAVTLDELRRAIDPAAAEKTVHWGRNYLYRTRLAVAEGELAVVVKVYRETGVRRSLARRFKGSKAQRSFDAALALVAAGVATPPPVATIEPRDGGRASFFVYRELDPVLEARYFFRARNQGGEGDRFPAIDPERLLAGLGAALGRMHAAGIWHRDVSAGNVLIVGDWSAGGGAGDRGAGERSAGELHLIDLARARVGKPLTTGERLRDLARLPLHRAGDRATLLARYFERDPSAFERGLFALHHHAFHLRHRLKDRMRGARRAARGLVSRSAHPHLPEAPADAPVRERVVWDPLSDQPHLHAGRAAKLRTRLADSGVHAREAAVLLGRLPAIARRYRALRRALYAAPSPFGDAGVGIQGGAAPAAEQVAEIEALGVRRVLLRIQPWEDALARDAELARELVARGCDVVLAVAQNRELVRDPGRWRAALAEIAERFDGLASQAQIGHAINRSKWGIWNQSEYAELVRAAAEVFAARAGADGSGAPAIKIIGPGVIDFELYVTCIALDWPENPVRFDAVSSLLYVDRRGAPENAQAGLDAVGKATLLRALIQTSRDGERESWITEVNWPLQEGPHSPAGRHVAVSEEAQASYLARYYLLMLGCGMVERVYWWQLVARGYGLADRDDRGLRRRPSWQALRFLAAALGASHSIGPQPAAAPLRVHAFEHPGAGGWLVAWSAADRPVEWKLPAAPLRVFDRDGSELAAPSSGRLAVTGAPVYVEVEDATLLSRR